MKTAIRFWLDEDGATAIEYALIASLAAIAAIAAMTAFSTNVSAMWNNLATHV